MKQQAAPVTRFRHAAKREGIVEALRREIARGKFKPNERLPKQVEFSRRFGVSVLTVQRAMDRLVHEGFIETRHSQGTFVVNHPPHLNRYALIFSADPGDPVPGGWSHFYATLVNEATRIQRTEKRQIECFFGIHGATQWPQYQRLVSRVEAHQFAGLIFASHPYPVLGTPLLEREGIPRVGLMTYDPVNPMMPTVQLEHVPWFEKALDYLASRGRRRVAFVNRASPKPLLEWERLSPLLTARGLTTRPYWELALPLWSHGASHSAQLLMQSAGERPDALVITDDNAVEPAVAGLMAAGVRVPDDVEVVAHANFPRSGPRVLPLKWLGYDNRAVLQACLSIIDQQCRGEKPPIATMIAPVFEEELATQKPAVELGSAR